MLNERLGAIVRSYGRELEPAALVLAGALMERNDARAAAIRAAWKDGPRDVYKRWRRLRDDSLSEPGRMRVHIAEHRMIYEAVIEGDVEAAELFSRQHIRRVRRYMTLADSQQPGE